MMERRSFILIMSCPATCKFYIFNGPQYYCIDARCEYASHKTIKIIKSFSGGKSKRTTLIRGSLEASPGNGCS